MKNIMLITFILVAAVVLQSCHKISGHGPVITKEYNLGTFTAFDNGIDADLYFTQDSTYHVEISAQQDILDIIETPVINGRLSLQVEKYKNIGHHDRIIVRISAPSITAMGVNGSGTVTALQPVAAGNLSLSVNGSGKLSVAAFAGNTLAADISGSGSIYVNGGQCSNVAAHISGSGEIDLLGVNARTGAVETSGSGKTCIWATDRLDVRISGSGDVLYKGTPSIHSEISGSGRIKPL
ncbi:MAG: head GIN domain-containing protein [Bacteroidota bacterium]